MKPLLIIDNDQDAKCILLEAGWLGELNPGPGYNTAITRFKHGGYDFLAYRHAGNAKPEDNGYVLVGIPEEMPEAERTAFFDDLIIGYSQEQLCGEISIHHSTPAQN